MAPNTIDLDSFRTVITELWEIGLGEQAIRQHLSTEHALTVGRSTLYKFVKQWDLPRQARIILNDELRDRIYALYFELGLSDPELFQQLGTEGFTITRRGLAGFRRQLGLYRRRTAEELEASREELRNFFEQYQHDQVLRSLGRGHLYTHLRQQQMNISRNVAYSVYREFFMDEVERRKQRLAYRRTGWTSPGPDFVWSIDGHAKLARWGFEVYGAIDAYSRYITWFYVGNSAATAQSVAIQYLWAVGHLQYVPQLVRSDRGKETVLLCAAHFYLSQLQRKKRFVSEETGQEYEADLTFRDCCVYGKSIHNSRIEAWWGQLQKSRALVWRVRSLYFEAVQWSSNTFSLTFNGSKVKDSGMETTKLTVLLCFTSSPRKSAKS